MSIYNNDTSKIYTYLIPMAPQEPQAYGVKKLTEIWTYLLDEIKNCEKLAKKMKQTNTITSVVKAGLITSTVITGRGSIATYVLACLFVLH